MPTTIETPRTRQLRLQGRDMYSALKSGGSTSLPPLRAVPPGLPPDPLAQRAPADESRIATAVPIEVSSMESALAALAERVGNLYGLPELHVLIQDTVSVTLRGISSIVETHVTRVLETEQFGVVQEMVIRLLTEEVVRVTAQSAHALFRREISAMDANQKQAMETFAKAEKAWHRRFDEQSRGQSALQEECTRGAAERRKLWDRVADIEHSLAELPKAVAGLAEAVGRIEGLEAAQSATSADSLDLRSRLSDVEQQCEARFAAKPDLAQAAQDIQGLRQWQEDRGDKWFEDLLAPLVQKRDFADHMAEFERRAEERSSAMSDAFAQDVEAVRGTALARCGELEQYRATRLELSDAQQAEQDSRAKLEASLRADLASLRNESAMQAVVQRALEAQQREHAALAGTHHELHAHVEQQSAEARGSADALKKQLEQHAATNTALQERLAAFAADVSAVQDSNALIRESFNDERKRNEAIFHQQQQNRKELNHMIENLNELGGLRSSVQALQAGAEKQEQTIQHLHQEVGQWEDAVAAQQGLRKEMTQLRAHMDEAKVNIEKVGKEQALGIDSLRALHSSWLKPAVATAPA